MFTRRVTNHKAAAAVLVAAVALTFYGLTSLAFSEVGLPLVSETVTYDQDCVASVRLGEEPAATCVRERTATVRYEDGRVATIDDADKWTEVAIAQRRADSLRWTAAGAALLLTGGVLAAAPRRRLRHA